MHPVCIVARYVGEILQQALKADMLVVIAANSGRCVRSTKFCVFVVQHMYVFIRLERKSNGVMKSIERLDVLHTGEITEKPAIR